MNSSTEKTWLVKSSGMILGPFSIDDLVLALKEKKVSLIDEVRSPENRWAFIREHQQFKAIVQKLRQQLASSAEDTASQTLAESTQTDTETATESATEIQVEISSPGELTPEPHFNHQVETKASFKAEPAPAAVFASSSDQNIKRRISKENRSWTVLIWILVTLSFAGVLGVWSLKKESNKHLGFEDYLKRAQIYKNLGQWENALGDFKKAEAIHPLDFKSKLQMAPLLMVVENQNVQARQNLESLLASPQANDKAKLEILSLVALSYLREVQLDEAEKRYNDILAQHPEDEVSKMNLLEIQILQADFAGASRKISELMKDKEPDPLLILYRALVIYRTSSDEENLRSAEEDLNRYLSRSQDFEPEVLLLRAAILKKIQKPTEVTGALNRLLSVYPDLTKEHLHDYSIHREVLQWTYLLNVCEILLQDAASSSLFSGLRSYCSYQQGDLRAALQSIDQARLQNTQDPTLIGLNAFLLVKAGRSSEAQALYQLGSAQASAVIHSIRARKCQELKDSNCAEEQWKLLREADPHNVESFAGLARVFMSRGQKEFASDMVRQGLLISANYQPLLQIKEQLNAP